MNSTFGAGVTFSGMHIMRLTGRRSFGILLAAGLLLGGCASIESAVSSITGKTSVDSSQPARQTARHRVGKPYVIKGVRYVPREQPGFDVVGTASWYGRPFHGRRTASGQIYNMYAFTAAHPTLPLGARVHVTNLANNRSVVLTINDRGPFARGWLIDVSRRAAESLGFLRKGTTRVRVRIASVASS